MPHLTSNVKEHSENANFLTMRKLYARTANGWLLDHEQQLFYLGICTLDKPGNKYTSHAGDYFKK